ncbi:MAG: tetratricopeptide repeat protein [Treponema sp.]|jgi:hypothetical protein|nr:tetratricopeptide repeat protein [Treponema sp.]
MPSLQALREFKTSFDEIGDEKAVLEAQNLPYEDLPFPEVEAELPDTTAEDDERAAALDTLSQMDLDPAVAAALGLPEADGSGEADEAPAGLSSEELEAALSGEDTFLPLGQDDAPDPALGDFDLDALLGAVPGDLPDISDDLPNIPDDQPNMSAESPEIPDESDESFDISGEAPDPDSSGELADSSGELPDISEESSSSSDELADISDELLDISDESFDISGEAPDSAAEDGDAEVPAEDIDLSSLLNGLADDLDQSPADAEDQDPEAETGDFNLDLDDAANFGLDLDPEAETGFEPDIETGEALDLDLGEGFGEADLTGENTDSFDNFDLEQKEPVPEEEDESAGMDLGDFTLPGIDDMLGGIPGQAPQEAGKGKGRKSFFGGPPPDETEPEEIRLDEYELAQLRRTLAGYPLNLRVAIEEIITEQAVPPDQMASLVRLLTRGAIPKEAAALAGKILGKTIKVPVQKKSGEQLEAEQGSPAYIFVHNFLPIFRLFFFIVLVAASSFYLIWHFIYTPLHAENIYKLGYERINAGEYERANQRFTQAFNIHRDKDWFYRYAEAFRDQRQYIYAEEKYDELLSYYPRDKKGVLDYAAMETYYRRNYEKADLLLRRNILEFNVNDREALLAQGDNALLWGEIDPARYEDARFAYARLLERYGWTDPIAERMLRYFIRTDNLGEVIPLQFFFMDNPKKKISAETLAELGGYLLDKRTEEVRGVPSAYVEQISGVRDVLLRAVLLGPSLPEAHYHLSRYYRSLGSRRDEQLTLEVALRSFENAAEESVRRLVYHIDALAREAEILRDQREYFNAEERLVRAIGLYEGGLDRQILRPAPEFGRLYAAMGDLEYFTKSGDMEMTLSYYLNAERTGYSSPEMLYRMGSAYYHQENWANALERFFSASSQLPLDRRILLALGNTCWRRGDFFTAQGYYNRLLDLLEAERSRLPVLLPNDRPEYIETAERLMIARNNMGATLEALAQQTGNSRYRSQALNFYIQSSQAWDALTRNPQTMIRLGSGDLSNPGINLAYLNSRNILYPQTGYETQVFSQIDKDILDPSPWED